MRFITTCFGGLQIWCSQCAWWSQGVGALGWYCGHACDVEVCDMCALWHQTPLLIRSEVFSEGSGLSIVGRYSPPFRSVDFGLSFVSVSHQTEFLTCCVRASC